MKYLNPLQLLSKIILEIQDRFAVRIMNQDANNHLMTIFVIGKDKVLMAL